MNSTNIVAAPILVSVDEPPKTEEPIITANVPSSDIGAVAPILPTAPTTTILCRYFQRGMCRFGPLCRYSHDATLFDGAEVSNNSESGSDTSIPDSIQTSDDSDMQPSTSFAINQYKNWIDAPIFVPTRLINEKTTPQPPDAEGAAALETVMKGSEAEDYDTNNASSSAKTWAEVVGAGGEPYFALNGEPGATNMICPYESPCPYGAYCGAMHLDLCKMCDQYCLHPTDLDQRRNHNKECLQQHEQAMELSFAIARSKDKTCGICFDTIIEKAGREKRFGILPNCSHIFCLECIRKWRQAKQFEHKITRSCPECRIASDFVCPSAFWVETKEEKDKLLNDYRSALGVKDCKYFKKGAGKCPFGNKCFYKHALPNGELVDVGCPKRARKMQRSSSEIIDLLDIYLWEFVEQRDYHWLDMLSGNSDDSDDSDVSMD